MPLYLDNVTFPWSKH